MTHHESRIKEEEEETLSGDTPTTPSNQGKNSKNEIVKSFDFFIW